jgi:SOS-response transcriptional repressor LexA
VAEDPLTRRQGDALIALYKYVKAHGVSPSLDQLAVLIEVNSRSVIVSHMNTLEAHGMVGSQRHPETGHRYPRTWKLTERGRKWCVDTLALISRRGRPK